MFSNSFSRLTRQELRSPNRTRSTLSPRILRPIFLNDIDRFGYNIHNGAKCTAKCLAKRYSFVLQLAVLIISSLGRQRESKLCCIGHLEERKCRA